MMYEMRTAASVFYLNFDCSVAGYIDLDKMAYPETISDDRGADENDRISSLDDHATSPWLFVTDEGH